MKIPFEAAFKRLALRVVKRWDLPPGTWSGYTRDALALAEVVDCLPEQLAEAQQHPDRLNPDPGQRICHWFLPPFDNPFYGGVMTILRLSDYLRRTQGMRQRFLICGAADRAGTQAMLGKAFPGLADAEVIVLDSVQAIETIPPADYSVATLWTTAYVVLGVRNTALKFYMIQDFEPAFYPAGSTYAQAELTYHFGFYGIANTQSIREIYERDYGGRAVVLTPCVDRTVFFPRSEPLAPDPLRLFYYARPGIPRNAFELAAAALRRVKARLGERVDIVCAGAGWNPAEFGLDGVVRAVGLLPYAQTGDLYRSCHVGLAMMVTRHPSYLPFELMACGAVVVANQNPANTWLLRDRDNCLLSPPSASCLAATLIHALEHYESLAALRERAASEIATRYGSWDRSLESAAAFMLDPA